MEERMRRLKLDHDAVQRVLDMLDEQDVARTADALLTPGEERYPYRVRALQLDVGTPDELVTYLVPTRNIGRTGISLLIGNVVHTGSPCQLHLITIRNNWQSVTGKVVNCRYIQGSACVHEVSVAFDRPIDPASFAPTAVRTRVLIADDSPMARRLFGHVLQTMNADLTFAENGVEALDKANEESFDLILMDIEMPKLGGIEAVRILRSRGYIGPIVAISSLTDDATKARALAAGCDNYVEKPARRETLRLVIDQAKPEPLVSALLHEEDMQALIDEFVSDLPDRIRKLEEAFASESLEQLRIEARMIKGEGAGFGFEPISEAAAALETAAEHCKEVGELRGKLSDLVRLCMAARPATWHRTTSAADKEEAELEAILSDLDD